MGSEEAALLEEDEPIFPDQDTRPPRRAAKGPARCASVETRVAGPDLGPHNPVETDSETLT